MPTMVSTTHRYQIPVVSTDLPPSEALLQAFDTLAQLDGVINDVFKRIATRITEERSKLSSATSRISTAQSKIKLISENQTRVTTIFSTAKYPILKDRMDFERPIGYDGLQPQAVPLNRTPARLTPHQRSIPPAHIDTTTLFQSLPMSRTIRSAAITQQQQTSDAEGYEGLGRLPPYLPSVSSILLFNTDENPYKKYVSVNNLEGTGGKDREKDGTGPSAAPLSVLQGTELPSFAGFEYNYKPELGQLPTLDLPQNLPLSRIADLQYGASSQVSSIAPSVGNFSSLLPTFETLALPAPTRTKERISTVPTSSSSSSSSSSSASLPSSVTSAPPPPAPVAPSIPQAPAASIPQAPPQAPIIAPDAPPPPPLDMSTGPPVPAAPAPSSSGDSRSDLLASIRNAGMGMLKKAGNRGGGGGGGGGKTTGRKAKADREERPKPAADDGGGDLMSALRNHLKRRHDAISGKQSTVPDNNNNNSGNNEEKQRSLLRAPTGKINLPRLEDDTQSGAGGDDGGGDGGDQQEQGEADKKSGMPSNVMSALMSAHQRKQKNEETDWQDE